MSGEHGTPATADAESSAVPDADRLIQEMLCRSVVERAADEVTHNRNRPVTGPASQPDRGCDSREHWRFNVAVQRTLQLVSEGGSERCRVVPCAAVAPTRLISCVTCVTGAVSSVVVSIAFSCIGPLCCSHRVMTWCGKSAVC